MTRPEPQTFALRCKVCQCKITHLSAAMSCLLGRHVEGGDDD